MIDRKALGKKGEDVATRHLLASGYTILERNWTHEKAELDIIARINDTLVFVEVKTRSTNYWGEPEESVGKSKSANIFRAAEAYIAEKNLDCELRFDIISIIISGNKTKLRHIEDAIVPYDE